MKVLKERESWFKEKKTMIGIAEFLSEETKISSDVDGTRQRKKREARSERNDSSVSQASRA